MAKKHSDTTRKDSLPKAEKVRYAVPASAGTATKIANSNPNNDPKLRGDDEDGDTDDTDVQ